MRKKPLDAAMVENATIVLKNADDYLHTQEAQLKQELDEKADKAKILARYAKIEMINDVIGLINTSRVMGQRAQVKRDPTFLSDAISKFEATYQLIAQIRSTTIRPVNLEQLKNIENAAVKPMKLFKGLLR